MRRRVLTSLLTMLIVSAAFPLTVLGATQAFAPPLTTTNEDTPVTITLDGRDQSPIGGPITSFATGAAAHGTVGAPGPITCDTTGAKKCHADVVYTPVADYNGADQFTFTATGPDGPSAPATVSITINPVNDAPVCSGDASSGNEDTPQTGNLPCTDVDGNTLTYSKVGDPTHGSATVNGDGSWSYLPAANYHGSDSFAFRANDGTLNSGNSTMTITVVSVNDAPSCSDDSSGGFKNQQQTGTVSCTDVENDPLTYSKSSGPAHGSATVASNGDWTYDPTHNYSGSDSFTFKAHDGSADSADATMDLTVSATNAAPVCSPATHSGDEDTVQTGTLLCTDDDGDGLTYTKVAGPTHGSATVNSDGSWSYLPDPDYNGPDSFTFRANDGTVNSTTVTMSITVDPVNDPPVCSPGSSSGNEDTVQADNLSCTDGDGDTLTYSKVTDATHGSATVNSDGSWSYLPDPDYNGPDSFTFRANDGTVNSTTVTMSITVDPVNDPPVCSPGSSSGNEDTVQADNLSCTDGDGDTLTYSKVTDATHGSATVNSDGSWSYLPDPDYNGPDSFTFRANDGTVNSTTVTMSITVDPVNDPPVCSPGSSSGNEDTVQADNLSCTDGDGDTLTYSKVTDATHGSATVNSDGSWSYLPDPDYNGPDSFTFRANDGTVNSTTVTMSITVDPVNDPPVCSGLTLSTSKNTAVGGTVICTDPENDTLTLRVGTQPQSGTVLPFDPDTGGFTYTPDTDVTGSDTFTVIANDGSLDSAPALIGIGVDNQAPVCSDPAPASGNEDTLLSGPLSCTDANADTLSYLVVGQPTHGGAAINAITGHWTYTPDQDYNGTDSFTIAATDGADQSNSATVDITLNPVNDPPVCTPATSSGDEETNQSGTVVCTDVDGGPGPFTYTNTVVPTKGTLTVFDTDTGAWTYHPNTNRTGNDTFKVTASDGALTSAAATVTLTIVDVNDPPVAKSDFPTITATNTTTIAVTSNDLVGPVFGGVTSEPTDSITVTSVTGGTKGTPSIAPGGQGIVYDPRGCGYGSDTFSYTITDSHGATSQSSVFVTIARPGTSGRSKKPITDTPAIAFVAGSTIGSTTPMKLTWCGVTAGGAVKAYRIDQSTNGGSSYKTLIKATRSTSSTRNLAISTRYRWRARTTDKKDVTGAYRTSLVARTARYQDNSASIVYTGPWTNSATSSASGGTERFTTFAGADATLILPSTVRSFAIVGPRGSTRGSFQVTVDGVPVATVSEKVTGAAQYRKVLYVRGLSTGTSHTIRLVAVGNGRVDLDAILTLGT